MINLNINIKKLIPIVIDIFTEVYGIEYRDIIEKRINNALIILYYDIEGLSNYISFIKRCKRREYAIKFLDGIGFNVKKYIRDNYTQPLDDEVEKILKYYIDSSFWGFSKDADYWAPIQAFKPNNKTSPKQLLENKIRIINHLLGKKQSQLNEENFSSFIKTSEYQQILRKIDILSKVYEPLLSDYRNWEKQLLPYEEFIESEQKRKKEILKRKKMEMFLKISSRLPSHILNSTLYKTLEEKCEAILGSLDIDSNTIIESFSPEQMSKLKSKNVDLLSKYLIIYSQTNYLRNMGIDIPNKEILNCNSEKDVEEYLIFLNQDKVKKYIPSEDMIRFITSIRKEKYEEALKEYYMTRKDFIDAKSKLGNNQSSLKYAYDQIKNKKICIAGQGAFNADNAFISVMFFTIRVNGEGSLFYSFMHECEHIIDQSINGIGFESYDDFNENSLRNQYDSSARKYERFNETLNDIFAAEAIDLLHNRGIYLIEPQEFTLLDINNHNTALITKNILQPLVLKFRKQVISAKINANPEELIKFIGKNNFEDLVDAVNKVDYLSRNGVTSKIDTLPQDKMVKEYLEQVERVKQIYSDIDDYYKDNIKSFSLTSTEIK